MAYRGHYRAARESVMKLEIKKGDLNVPCFSFSLSLSLSQSPLGGAVRVFPRTIGRRSRLLTMNLSARREIRERCLSSAMFFFDMYNIKYART